MPVDDAAARGLSVQALNLSIVDNVPTTWMGRKEEDVKPLCLHTFNGHSSKTTMLERLDYKIISIISGCDTLFTTMYYSSAKAAVNVPP